MLIFTVLVTFFSVNGLARLSFAKEDEIYMKYMEKFAYETSDSAQQVFLEKFYKVKAHNEWYDEGLESYKMELNFFSHMTYESIIKYYTGLNRDNINTDDSDKVQVPKLPFNPDILPNITLPPNFSWTKTEGVVRPVQDQGLCGSCYIFATVGAIEGQLKLKYGFDTKISEQEVLDCVEYENEPLGCGGGFHVPVYNFAFQQNGITSEETYPYLGSESVCKPNSMVARDSKVQSYVEVPRDAELIKRVLFAQGPLYVSFFVSPSFTMYGGGVFTDSSGECDGMSSNHAVLLTGWGTDNGIDYWELKNSWQKSFGEDGFFRMERGKNLCNIESDVNYPNL